MLKRYKLGDFTYLFEEGKQPSGAILLDKDAKATTKTKEVKPRNKAKGVTTK